ncbi:MAG TPA: tetratricopeptide repeat protein [Fimbriimonadaceae bacterium]|nr:tetratricopeptide repeat protein [Fimbriimonadaceae bacterium]
MSALARARSLYAEGRLREAAALLAEALRKDARDAPAMALLAAIEFQGGRRREGLKLARDAVALDPRNADAWNNLGLMLHFLGDGQSALGAFVKATEAQPSFSEAWKNKGFVLQGLSRHEEALEALKRAGGTADAHFFRGNSHAALGDHERAVEEFESALRISPGHADAWNNRGSSLLELGRPHEAVESIKTALGLMPASSAPHCHLARALIAARRPDEALSVIDVVLKFEPGFTPAHALRSEAVAALDEMERETQRLSAEPERPSDVEERADLARRLQAQGRWSRAVALLGDATSDALRVLNAVLLPPVFESSSAMDGALAHLDEALAGLEERPPKLEDPHRQVGVTAFNLPYFGVSDRPYQERIAKMYREASAGLRFEASHSKRTDRPRIGILSGLLGEHTISRVFGGLIERLDRERFEKVFLRIGVGDEVSERIAQSCDRQVELDPVLGPAREQVARESIDILFYPEIGMDPLTYFLAFSRLAPIQCTTWGHPMTSGSPVMDFFLSSEHLEREDAQAEYTERLVRVPHLSSFYVKPQEPPSWGRADFMLPSDRRLYGCPQMPYKFHPDYDRVLASILERDERGLLVLIEPQRALFKQILQERWRRTHPILLERTVWLHLMPLNRFLRLLQLCDALLVPIQFGGGRTTLDALGVGAPAVTFEGAFLKSRITSAIYREMGFADLIASSEDSYIELALRLSRDREFQAHCRDNVSGLADVLYENRSAVDEFNGFFEDLGRGVL